MRASTPVALLALLVYSGTGCGPGEISPGTRARVEALGDSAAMTLVRTLGGRLNSHLATGEPGVAIAFCANEAQTLTDSVSRAMGEGWEVARTTRRTRNPANAPDALEMEALDHFHGAEGTADPLESLVQRTPDGDYRYYMPLRIGHMCLECHGPRESLGPAVRRVLDARYSADEATGYAQGDLRGLVRVTVPGNAVY